MTTSSKTVDVLRNQTIVGRFGRLSLATLSLLAWTGCGEDGPRASSPLGDASDSDSGDSSDTGEDAFSMDDDDDDTDGGNSDDGLDDDGLDDDTTGEMDDNNEIDDYIIGLGTLDTAGNALVEGEASEPASNGDYMCSTTNLAETKQFDKIVAFASNSGTLFPGAIIAGESIADGTLTPKVFDRAPLTFSASLEGVLDGDVSATLDEPTLSAFREAMADILSAKVIGNTPANIAYDMSEVHSSEQLSLALGLDVSWMSGNVSASMEFDQQNRNSRFLVNFTQAYYTVDIDPPGRPSDMLDTDVTLEDVEDILLDEPPTYVSSVTYGRIVYFAVTSNFSSEELRAALEFGFSTGAVDVDGSVSLTHSEVLAESQITAFILGGDGNVAVEAIQGADGIATFLQSGGTYSKDSPGAAIGYKLAYLADNSPARFALTTDYDVQDCVRVTQKVQLTLRNMYVVSDGADPGGDLELYGTIRGWDEASNAYQLMDRDDDEYVTIGSGQTWPQNGNIASQIIPVVPQSGHSFSITINLREADGFPNPDDSFGDHTIVVDYAEGWRDDNFIFSLADGDQQVEVRLAFTPVP
ncbi:MAG: thiol-activated cytolysin family protein [Nannocystaceae bacterium]|nr:thiol-activated cytolysin family protein [Nannocystaceae bacterium]